MANGYGFDMANGKAIAISHLPFAICHIKSIGIFLPVTIN
jgi:hypothetical protein